MILHRDEGLCSKTTIKDSNGKEISARLVFTHCIKFMKDDLMKMVERKKVDTEFKTENIRWVITVPAIWEEPAKQFMREAARELESREITYFWRWNLRLLLSTSKK